MTINNPNYDYGIIMFKHRFPMNRPLDDYKETVLTKCIATQIVYKYKTMSQDSLFAQMQVLYKDGNGNLKCMLFDLHEYTFEIQHLGNMRCVL